MEPVLDLTHVRKVYKGKVEALAGISLQVPKGCIFGLLGPNGAGKSTLVKILTTIIRPTQCQGTMLGERIGHKPTLRRIGYLPEHARFPPYLTGRQVIEYSAALSGAQVPAGRIGLMLEEVGMSRHADRPVKAYSKGMVQRVGLAQALVNEPELVFLDEPTDGVDPAGRRDMRGLLQKLRSEGRTVFVNSHLLGELEMVCDSVVILNEGHIVKHGKLEELTAGSRRFEVVADGEIPDELKARFRGDALLVDENRVEVRGGNPGPVQPVIDALRAAGVAIRSVQLKRQSLEELFLESTQATPPALPARTN